MAKSKLIEFEGLTQSIRKWSKNPKCLVNYRTLCENFKRGKKIPEAFKRTKEKDLLNKKFGKLIVLGKSLDKIKNRVTWVCCCECGNEIKVITGELNAGRVKSCGCYKETGLTKRLSPGHSACNALMSTYKLRAFKFSREFSLTNDEFRLITSMDCFYCGSVPSKVYKTHSNTGTYIYNGIDRVDNQKGYTIQNSVPCCKKCNSIKNSVSVEICRKILEFLEPK